MAAETLAEELRTLTVRALRERAAAEGVGAAQVEEARDGDDPQAELARLIAETVAAAAATFQANPGRPHDTDGLRSGLAGLNVGALRRRARDDGVAPAAIEEARDGDDPKGELIDLIVRLAERRQAEEARLRSQRALEEELHTLNVGALRKRAQTQGVDAARVEEARDGDDPKAELIQLILARAAIPGASSSLSSSASLSSGDRVPEGGEVAALPEGVPPQSSTA
eukprot:COSAG01_NODE_21204_length_913_cov_1.009828_1_plen_224_part_01